MLSKEEIEKAKEKCNTIVNFCENNQECQKNKICSDCYIEIEDISAIKTLLQYIEQVEADNYESNKILNEYIEDRKRQNKIIDLMAEQLSGLPILDIKKAEYITLGNKEETKQYFEREVDKDD